MDDNLGPMIPRTGGQPWRPELGHLIDDQPASAASPDALRSIVNRHQRWRTRTLAGVLAVAAIAGPAAGYAFGHSTSARTSTVSIATPPGGAQSNQGFAGAVEAPAFQTSSSSQAGPSILPGTPATQFVLRNTADGVRIRGYVAEFTTPLESGVCRTTPPAVGAATPVPACPSPGPTCQSPPDQAGRIEAQVSNDQVAGVNSGFFSGQQPAQASLEVVSSLIVGVNDPTPIATATTRTSPDVARVRLVLPGGKGDEMAPVNGLAIVAGGVTPDLTTPVPKPGPPAPPIVTPAAGAKAVRPAVTTPLPWFDLTLGTFFPKGSKVEALDAKGHVFAAVDLPSTVPSGRLKGSSCTPITPGVGNLRPPPLLRSDTTPPASTPLETPTTFANGGSSQPGGIDGRPAQTSRATPASQG